MAKVISVVNQKGGTGKSACTANLAVGLAQKNMKVLIVDADPQSDVSAGFGYRDCDDSNETLNEKVQVQIPAKKLKQYFPETYTKTQMEEIIFMLLASWAEREGKE